MRRLAHMSFASRLETFYRRVSQERDLATEFAKYAVWMDKGSAYTLDILIETLTASFPPRRQEYHIISGRDM